MIEENGGHYIVPEFAAICRLCLKKDGVMSCIFNNVTDNGEFEPLPARITDFFHIQVQENDGLPSKICHRCLYKTEKSTKFRQQCQVNEAKLLQLVHLQNEENMYLNRIKRECSGEASGDDNNSESCHNETNVQYRQRQVNKMPDMTGQYNNVTISKMNGMPYPNQNVESVVMVVDPDLDYNSSEESEGNQSDGDNQMADNMNQEPEFKNVSMCKYCDIAFKEEETCHQHELTQHNPETPFICQLCLTMFSERNQFIGHMKIVHEKERPYVCLECDKGFTRRSDLRKHTIVHTGVRPYSCYICTKAFSRNTNLTKHMRIHLGKKPHVCLKCSRSFISKMDLSRHMAVHTGAKPFECSQCDMAFSRKDKLQRHEKTHETREMLPKTVKESEDSDSDHGMVINIDPYEHGEYDQTVEGDQLEMDQEENNEGHEVLDFPSVPDHISGESHDLQDFYKTHVEENEPTTQNGHVKKTKNGKKLKKAFKCPQCSKKLSNMDNLRRHMYIHMGIKNHICPVCSKSFARKRELDRHSIVHTGFKPFECEMCDKKFGRKDKLIRHQRIHDELKCYECDECDSTFTRKDGLILHKKVHEIKTEIE